MMKLLKVLLLLSIAAGVVMVGRTLALTSRQPDWPPAQLLAVDADAAVARFAHALTFRTISWRSADPTVPAPVETAAFEAFHAYLRDSFPLVHEKLSLEKVGGLSLLYRWPGSDTSLRPMLLMGHMDVVPIEDGTEKDWQHPPFAGQIADGFIWGRGALDDKASVMATLEAAEALLGQGFVPQRTLYFAFGHDEEKGGRNGAVKIAELLKARGVRFSFLLDEGQPMTRGLVPGITAPVAAIALAEKGGASIELVAHADGGHSARPPWRTANGALARAVAALEARQMPATLKGTFGAMFDALAPEMGFVDRFMYANQWAFGEAFIRRMQASPQMNATMRTTTAVTWMEGGSPTGGLPSSARARFRFAIRPGNTADEVVAHVRNVINDPRIDVKLLGARPPSPVSDSDTAAFRAIARAVHEAFPEALVSPGQSLGGQDARHFISITDNAYRLVPVLLTANDMSRPHGTNERLPVDNYPRIIQFFGQVMRNGSRGE